MFQLLLDPGCQIMKVSLRNKIATIVFLILVCLVGLVGWGVNSMGRNYYVPPEGVQRLVSPDGRHTAEFATYNGSFDGWQDVTLASQTWFPITPTVVAQNGDEWGINRIAWRGSKTLVIYLCSDFSGKTADFLCPRCQGVSVIVKKDSNSDIQNVVGS
jgi:hypothetical protein